MKTINYSPDPHQKPQLSEAEEARLASLSDEEIDYSDIEALDDDFWEQAEMVSPDLTQPITLRVKQSVLHYFQAQGKKGYQSRMNAVLESYVNAQKNKTGDVWSFLQIKALLAIAPLGNLTFPCPAAPSRELFPCNPDDRLTIEGQLQGGLSGDGLGDSQGDFKALLDIA